MVIELSTRANDDLTDGSPAQEHPATITTVESYETEEGVVFYDAENPLAWVETARPISLDEIA